MKSFFKILCLTAILVIYQNCGSAFNSFDSAGSGSFSSDGKGVGQAPFPDSSGFSFAQKLNFIYQPNSRIKLASGTVDPEGITCSNPNAEIEPFYAGKITRFELQNIIEDVLGLKDRIHSANLTTSMLSNPSAPEGLTQSQSGLVFKSIENYPVLNEENHFEEMNKLKIEPGFLNIMINIGNRIGEIFATTVVNKTNPMLNKVGACQELNKECADYLEKFVYPLLWRKELSAEEKKIISRYLPNSGENAEQFKANIKTSIKIMLASPQFFIKNSLPGKHSNNGPFDIFSLGQMELANRLSFYISSSAPDILLYNDALAGKLDNSSLVAHAKRLISDEKNLWRFNKTFYGSWLKINRSMNDTSRFQSSDPSVSSPNKIRYVVAHEALNETFRATNENKNSASLINNLNKGLITSENFAMTTHSRPNETSLIKRGIFVFEKVLCGELPDLTPADRTEIELTEQTIDQSLSPIEKLAVHRSNARCNSCHQYIDPLAIGLEAIDPFGIPRGTYPDGQPLITRSVAGAKSYNNLNEFVDIVSHSIDYRSCFVSQLANKFQKNRDNRIKPCLMTSSMNGNSELGIKEMIINMVNSPSFKFVKKSTEE